MIGKYVSATFLKNPLIFICRVNNFPPKLASKVLPQPLSKSTFLLPCLVSVWKGGEDAGDGGNLFSG